MDSINSIDSEKKEKYYNESHADGYNNWKQTNVFVQVVKFLFTDLTIFTDQSNQLVAN